MYITFLTTPYRISFIFVILFANEKYWLCFVHEIQNVGFVSTKLNEN